MTIIYEFPSDDGNIGPFVPKEVPWLTFKVGPLKSCLSAIRLQWGEHLSGCHVRQSSQISLIDIGRAEKKLSCEIMICFFF